MKTNTSTTMRFAMVAVTMAFVAVPAVAFSFAHNKTPSGDSVRWNRQSISIVLDSSLAQIGPIDDVENTIAAAFDEWVDAGDLPVDFDFSNGDCQAGYEQDGTNINCILAEEGDSSANWGASTLVTYSPDNGYIRDADLRINNKSGMWSVGDQQGTHSLWLAVLHEVGHVLGMSHSDVEEARMAPSMSAGDGTEEMALYSDDLSGVTELYEEFTVVGEFSTCSVSNVGGGDMNLGWVVLLVGLGALLAARRVSDGDQMVMPDEKVNVRHVEMDRERDRLDRNLRAEWRYSVWNGAPLSLMMISLNDYTSIWANHGEVAFEQVMSTAELLIRGVLRSRDTVVRFDAVTIGVILAETTEEEARETAADVVTVLEDTEYGDADESIRVSFAAGLSTQHAHQQRALEEIRKEALLTAPCDDPQDRESESSVMVGE